MCLDVGKTDCTRYLDTDYTAVCHGAKYDAYVLAAYVLGSLYAAVLPLALFLTLYRAHRRGMLPAKAGDTAFAKGLAFFHDEYKL